MKKNNTLSTTSAWCGFQAGDIILVNHASKENENHQYILSSWAHLMSPKEADGYWKIISVSSNGMEIKRARWWHVLIFKIRQRWLND